MPWNYSNTTLETTLTASVSPSATTISVASTNGLPVSFPYTLILDFEQPTVEVVTVTGLAGLNLTVTRGEDGTAAQAHSLGAKVVHGLVARDAREPQTHIAATQDVHGVGPANAVVGTGTAQTLTNKTISGSANTLSNVPSAAVTQPFAILDSSGQVTVTRATAADHGYRSKVTGDADHRVIIRADGRILIGDGATPPDTNLYRSSADVLKTDDEFEAVTGFTTNGTVKATRPTNGDDVLRGQVGGDAQARTAVKADGKIEWGDGTNPRDTNLYRSAANILKTDDNLEVAGNLTVTGVGGFLFARKTAIESVTNSTTLQDDNHLFVNVVAGAVYIVDGLIFYEAPTAADLLVAFVAPAGSSFYWTLWGPSINATGTEASIETKLDLLADSNRAGGAGSTAVSARPTGLLVAGTSGTFKLQWAQGSADASSTYVYANSWLRLQRIA